MKKNIFTDKKHTKVLHFENNEKTKNAASYGLGIISGTTVTALIMGTMLSLSSCKAEKELEKKDPEITTTKITNAVTETSQVTTTKTEIKKEFTDINNDDEVEKRATKIFNNLNELDITFNIPSENGERPINKDDIKAMIYWCNYRDVEERNFNKICDMDTAALLFSQLSVNYEMAGETSQRVAGITDLKEDKNAGKYNFSFGEFFPDDSLQKEELDKIALYNNYIKNHPTKESKPMANRLYQEAMEQFVFDDTSMELYSDEYDTANFIYGMNVLTNQTVFDYNPIYEKDNIVYNNYNGLVKNLNEVDGPVNAIGRSIEKNLEEQKCKTLQLTNN